MLKKYQFKVVMITSGLLLPSLSYPACSGTSLQSSNHCMYFLDAGTIGGDLQGSTHKFLATDMYPYQKNNTSSEIAFHYEQAMRYLGEGESFRQQNLLLMDAASGTPKGSMIANPKLNYETAGLLTTLPSIEVNLRTARDTFAYDIFVGYPDPATAQTKLRDTIKLLANIYLMIGDEYLIDALEYRFSSSILGYDSKLDEQITLLNKAQLYYQKALDSFIYGFSPAVGTNIFTSDYFDDSVYGLFKLSVERMSLALREKSSKQLVRQMIPDPTQQWAQAQAAALDTLKTANITTYLAAAAIAQEQGSSFDDIGSDSAIINSLNALRKQGNIYNQQLNPLGYDNRYVPLEDYEDLISLAKGWLSTAKSKEADFNNESRSFDANKEALMGQINSLTSQYVGSLSSFTGCTVPNTSNSTQVQAFIDCTGIAGGDLYDCSFNIVSADFDNCVSSKSTKGVLAAKYRNIMAAELRVRSATLRQQNILERINIENEKSTQLIELERTDLAAQKTTLKDYYEKLKDARTITETKTTTTTRKKMNGKYVKEPKQKTSSIAENFILKDERLQLDIDKEDKLREITTDYKINSINISTSSTIKDLLLSHTEAEIEIDLAVQQMNSAIADFDASLQEKEQLWYLYQNSLDQLSYYEEKYAPLRILRSQAAIKLAEALDYTAHYSYLAAKALEYKYLNTLDDEPVAGGRLQLTELFKAQTPTDIEFFINKLDSLNIQECPWGTFDPQYYVVSLAIHILGLTDRYLDPDGDGKTADGKTIEKARREAVQAFLIENIQSDGTLKFNFTIAEDASFLVNSGLFNLKIWSGSVPATCDALVSPVTGTAINIQTTQTGNVRPRIRIKQLGHSTLRNQLGVVQEYIPVTNYHFLFEQGTGNYTPFKEAEITSFINVFDPRNTPGTGTWTGAFKGRSISSSEWEIKIFDANQLFTPTDFTKITDIQLNIDAIGECCY